MVYAGHGGAAILGCLGGCHHVSSGRWSPRHTVRMYPLANPRSTSRFAICSVLIMPVSSRGASSWVRRLVRARLDRFLRGMSVLPCRGDRAVSCGRQCACLLYTSDAVDE